MSSKIKSFAQLQAMSPAELLTFHQTDNEPGDFYRLEYGDLLAKALEKALAATPAPASDEVLAELEGLKPISELPWKAEIHRGDTGTIRSATYNHAENLGAGPFRTADLLLENSEFAHAQDIAYIVALANAAPALLARVRQAEAKVAKVYQVLDAECKRLLDDADSNCTPEQKTFYQNQLGALDLFEMHLEKVVARPTVKGGQQDA